MVSVPPELTSEPGEGPDKLPFDEMVNVILLDVDIKASFFMW